MSRPASENNNKKRKPANLIYGLDDPVPGPTCLLLGLQHSFHVTTALIFAMIVIQAMGGSRETAGFFISMSLLAGGIAVILQALNRKGFGSGYFAPSVCEPAYLSAAVLAAKTGGLPLVLGMTALSGLFEMAISRVVHRLRSIFTPEVMGLVVAMVGVSVIPVAVRNFLGITEQSPAINPGVVAVSIITLGTMAAITIWSRGKLRLFSVIIGMVVGYIVSYLAGFLPAAHIQQIADKPWLALPDFRMLGWSFDASLVLPFLIASLSTSVKTIGNLTTCQKINDADWKRPDMTNIRKGLLADGFSVSLSGLLGGMAQSTASSNIGLALGTGATSRRIAFAAGGILIALAFFPRFAEVFVVMPQPVMGATPLFAVCFIIFTGFQIMMSRMMDQRKIFILGISLVFGLSVSALVQTYAQIETAWLRPLFSSSLYIATILAIALTILFRIGLTKKEKTTLIPGRTSYDEIRELLEKQGALWGARREVIERAARALNECMELLAAEALAETPVWIEISFDEFDLDLVLEYDGRPLNLDADYAAPGSLDDDVSLTLLSLRLIRQDVDRLGAAEKDGRQRITLHYDH
ncbi:MAG: xanthine permease [Deltaproteobacteria bacterium]|nr:xanthine permease [Deltaproteobacteria bacterium]